ncbi:hypothetical protein L873DRAFT_1887484, partial [Choiromyces venosus 120613-1]
SHKGDGLNIGGGECTVNGVLKLHSSGGEQGAITLDDQPPLSHGDALFCRRGIGQGGGFGCRGRFLCGGGSPLPLPDNCRPRSGTNGGRGRGRRGGKLMGWGRGRLWCHVGIRG